MPYTPDPTNPLQPVDTVDISTAAAEFRALKTWLLLKRSAVYEYNSWDPLDVTGTTSPPSTGTLVSAAPEFILPVNAAGTLTFTCVEPGLFRFNVNGFNEGAAASTRLIQTAVLGGTADILLGAPTQLIVWGDWENTSPGGQMGGSCQFEALMTAGQTVTILPKIAVTSGGVVANFTNQCSVSAEWLGTN